jgi:hypothetical protein
MRRAFIAGATLLFCGAIAARSKTEPLVFVFLRVDRTQDVAILRPRIAPDIGAQLDSGSRQLKQGTVLQCVPSMREHHAIVEGQTSKVTDLLLNCGDQTFVVKTLDFTRQTQ